MVSVKTKYRNVLETDDDMDVVYPALSLDLHA